MSEGAVGAQSAGSRASINVTLPTEQTPKSRQKREQSTVSFQDALETEIQNAKGPPGLSQKEVDRLVAARVIEKAWLSYRDRQMFKLLKHAVCAAEHSLTYEILRKVSPQEAALLKDPSLMVRVRFRFGGSEFPPMIFFKIFTHGKGVNYISGKRVLRPSTEAAREACNLMGNRKYLNQMIQDTVHHEQFGITDEIDVTTMKDYMQYLSKLDETPAYMGGRENLWRKLTLEHLPRTTIFYDVVDFLYSHRLTPRLKQELPRLISRPVTQKVQLQHIKIISSLRDPLPPPDFDKSKYAVSRESTMVSARRSKQARQKVMKMRKMYGLDTRSDMSSSVAPTPSRAGQVDHFPQQKDEYGLSGGEEEWEEEADKLYEWTQDLHYDDIDSPRLGTA